jgi:hypothetical protein
MNNMDTLREHLFATLEGLKNGSIDVEKAKVMGEVSQVLINSAKLEVDYIRAKNGTGNSSFLLTNSEHTKETPTGQLTVNGNSTVHRLR